MLCEDFFEAGAAGFLFAFNDELQVRPLVSEQLAHLLRCGDMRDDARLVVGGSASVEPVAADFGFERCALPQGLAHRGLHVVVGVEQDGRLVGTGEAFGVDRGPSARREQELDIGEARFGKHGLYGFCAVHHELLVKIVKTDGRDAD